MRNNDPGRDAIIAVQEERARIGGVEVTRQTLIAATDEGLVFEIGHIKYGRWLSWNSLLKKHTIYTNKSFNR